jgi:SHS2 domain-containing protein
VSQYTLFDHTADLGIAVRGGDLADLFANAAFAVFDLMTELDAVETRVTHSMTVTGQDREDLFVNFLRELLYLFNGRGFLVTRCDIRIDAPSPEPPGLPGPVEDSAQRDGREAPTDPTVWILTASVAGEPFDPSHHRMKMEIKAVTYHQIEVRETPLGWEGRFICDV